MELNINEESNMDMLECYMYDSMLDCHIIIVTKSLLLPMCYCLL